MKATDLMSDVPESTPDENIPRHAGLPPWRNDGAAVGVEEVQVGRGDIEGNLLSTRAATR